MGVLKDDPFEVLVVETAGDDFASLAKGPVLMTPEPRDVPGASLGRFYGFGLDEQPMVTGVPGLSGEIVAALTTVPLQRQHIGATVVLLFEDGNPRKPIVMGVVGENRTRPGERTPSSVVSVQVDDDRMVLSAEREIVLRCGEASITLTRAGKVLIKGTYVLSQSSGYNKIKGAAVDIN